MRYQPIHSCVGKTPHMFECASRDWSRIVSNTDPSSISRWFQQLEERTDIRKGRPLYSYCCTDEEIQQLRYLLARSLERTDTFAVLKGRACAAFCIFVSEWWRREYKGGPWRWSDVLGALGAEMTSSHQALYKVVEEGLAYWGRPLLRLGDSRRFLGTLASEGGLPLGLVRRQGTSLHRFFRAVFDDLEVFGQGCAPETVAEMASRHLPRVMRRPEIFLLAGQLAQRIRGLHKHCENAPDPMERLDRVCPDWREEMPLRVTDDNAQALIRMLFRQADTARSRRGGRIRVLTELSCNGGVWSLKRSLQLPGVFHEATLAPWLGVDADELPTRFEVFAQIGGDERLVALATAQPHDDGESRFRLEQVGNSLERQTQNEGHRVEVIGRRSGRELFRFCPPAGEALTDLPWVFVSIEGSETHYRLFRQGSARVPNEACLVALAEECVVQPSETCLVVGEIPKPKRALYEVRGELSLHFDAGLCTVRTADRVDDSGEYRLGGKTLPESLGREPVFVGVPSVRILSAEGGLLWTLPGTDLEWCRADSKSWQPISADCFGAVRLRHCVGGNLRWVRHVQILPDSTEVKIEPGSDLSGNHDPKRAERGGLIEISGAQIEAMGAESFSGSTRMMNDTKTDRLRLELATSSEPPANVGIRLKWIDGTEMAILLAYPSKGGRFLDRSGNTLGRNTNLGLAEIHGVIGVASDPGGRPYILGRLQCAGGYGGLWECSATITKDRTGRYTIDLGLIVDRLELLFSNTTDVDAWVDLRLMVDGDAEWNDRRLRVARFGGRVRHFEDTDEYDLAPGAFGDGELADRIMPSEDQERYLTALPLWDSEGSFDLAATGAGVWKGKVQMDPGPWLILGYEGDLSIHRPLLKYIPGRLPPEAEGDKWRALCQIGVSRERRDAFDVLVQEMAVDPSHQSWPVMLGFLRFAETIPPTTFDGLDRLAANPDAAALALVLLPLESAWRTLERLPFAWSVVPVRAWIAAAKSVRETVYCEAVAAGLTRAEQYMDGALEPFFNAAKRFPEFMQVVVDVVREETPGLTARSGTPLGLARQGMGAALTAIRDQAAQDLTATHADSRWPQWKDLREVTNRLVERIPMPEPLTLFPDFRQVPHRAAALWAPVVAALFSAFDLDPNPLTVFRLREMALFDPEYFRQVHAVTMARACGWILENQPELFR